MINLTDMERAVLKMLVNRANLCVADTDTYAMFRDNGIPDTVESMIEALGALNSLVEREIVFVQTADWKELSNPHRSRPIYAVGTQTAIRYRSVL